MLDFGWQEFLVVAVVTVLVVGPKELPRVFRTITGFMRKARSLAGEFHSAMDDMAKEADLQDIKKQVEGVKNGSSSWVKEIDPTGEVEKSVRDMKSEVNSARGEVNKAGRAESDKASSPSTTTPKPDVKADATSVPENSKKSAAKPTAAKKAAPKKAAAKKAAAKKVAAKQASSKKSAAKKAAAKSAAKPASSASS